MAKLFIDNIEKDILIDDEDFERVKFYKRHCSFAHDSHRFLT